MSPQVKQNLTVDNAGPSLELKVNTLEYGIARPVLSWSSELDSTNYYYLDLLISKSQNGKDWGEEKAIDVYGSKKYDLELDDNFIRVRLAYSNQQGQETLSSDSVIFDPVGALDFFGSYSFFNDSTGLSINQNTRVFGGVKGSISIVRPPNFDFNESSQFKLEYKNEAARSWSFVEINVPKKTSKTESEISFNFESTIDITSEGIPVLFKINFYDPRVGQRISREKTLSFEAVKPIQTVNSTTTNLPLNPKSSKKANLRYEIKTKISEAYFLNKQEGYNSELIHYFLDSEKYKETEFRDLSWQIFPDRKGFLYEAKEVDPGVPLGYFYPASISEILPCVNLIKDSDLVTQQVNLSWKVIDNFFDYNFFNNQLRIKTEELLVLIKYNNVIIVDDLSLNKENNYKNNSFVITLSRDFIDSTKLPHYDKIKLEDNNNDKLIVEIKSHKVVCSSPLSSQEYSFPKMMVPPEWNHILYDEYRNKNQDEGDFLNLPLDSKSLRGIRLPEESFKIFYSIENWSEKSTQGGSDVVYDTKILYKLISEASAIYLDPIREGTITYVQLPQTELNQVFLTAPDLKFPDPNIDPDNGKKAEGEVVLDEYGKIAGVKITDPGYGYSMFKTEADKREQNFVDFVPVVRSRFRIRSTNSGVTKQKLTPQNNSFSRLIASISGGTPLNQIGSNSLSTLNEEQEQIIKDYLTRNLGDDEVGDAGEETNHYDNLNDNSSNLSSLETLDPEWYKITVLYSDKNNNSIDEFKIYNSDIDQNINSLEDSDVSDQIQAAGTALDISNTDITEFTDPEAAGDGNLFSLDALPIFTDASAAISVFDPTAGPPSLTLLPLDVRSDAAPAYGALPNMLTRANSFFNRIVDGVNNLNQVRLMLPTVWGVDLIEQTTDWVRDAPAESPSLIDFQKTGEIVSNNRIESYNIPSNGRGIGARVERSVRVRSDNGLIQSTEKNQSMNITPVIHPWMADAIPDFYTKSFSRKYLALEVKRVEECDSFTPFQEGGVGILNGCGTSLEIPANTSVPDGRVVTKGIDLKFFNGGGISLQPYGTAKSFTFQYDGNNWCNTFSCASVSDVEYDFRYSNMYPAVLRIQ